MADQNSASGPRQIVTVGDDEGHVVGDVACPQCWSGYPVAHVDCGGLMHAAFGDENYDGDYWLSTKCDRCGEHE